MKNDSLCATNMCGGCGTCGYFELSINIPNEARKIKRIMYEQYFFLAKGMFPPLRSRMKPGMVGWKKARIKTKAEYKLWKKHGGTVEVI